MYSPSVTSASATRRLARSTPSCRRASGTIAISNRRSRPSAPCSRCATSAGRSLAARPISTASRFDASGWGACRIEPVAAWCDSVSKIENAGANARTVPSSSSIVRVRTSRSVGRRTACERPAATSRPSAAGSDQSRSGRSAQSASSDCTTGRKARRSTWAPTRPRSSQASTTQSASCSTKASAKAVKARRRRLSRRPTMPKSWKQMRPSAMTNRLPGCGSP